MITLEKAIEVNTNELAPLLVGKKIEWQKALWLGIEALKRIHADRVDGGLFGVPLLPGEVEE